MLDTVLRDKREVFRANQAGAGIERCVEHDGAGLRRKGSSQFSWVNAPIGRAEADKTSGSPCPAQHGEIAVVHRFEQDDFVAGRQDGEKCGSQSFRGAGGDSDLALPVELDARQAGVVLGDGFAQLRQATHGRVLVGAAHHSVGGALANVFGSIPFGKALPQIHRAGFAGETRHDIEDGVSERGVDRVHVPGDANGRTWRSEGILPRTSSTFDRSSVAAMTPGSVPASARISPHGSMMREWP